uniref:Titin n=1 Tax=Haemonchus contortus TaxID=6289 RepID=A0A7I4XTD6_HAECO|nr:Thrombospondin domain containing protein [Haemonchus contortus]
MTRQLAAVHVLCLLIPFTAARTTEEPSWAPTGKLNQFRGFVTPRPLPPNADFVYASVWGGWSSWSFCSNGMKVRVRACNTVRGFSCLGPNQEVEPCYGNVFPPSHREKVPSDYDVVDPYEADRREAMKQLYPDEAPLEQPSPPPQPTRAVPNFVKIPKPDEHEFRRVHAAQPIQSSQEAIELERAIKELLIQKPASAATALANHLSSEQLNIQEEELNEALSSLQIRNEGRLGGTRDHSSQEVWRPKEQVASTTKPSAENSTEIQSMENKSVENSPASEQKEKAKVENPNVKDHMDITNPDFLDEDHLPAEFQQRETASPSEIPHNEDFIRVDLNKEAPPPVSTTTDPNVIEEIKHLLDDEDHFEKFGTRPEIVQPQLSNSIDEDTEPVVVTPAPPEPTTITFPTMPSTTSTAATTTVVNEAAGFIEPVVVNKPLVSAKVTSYGLSKPLPETVMKQKKNKGFGFTGFAFRKSSDSKRFIHYGEVTKKTPTPENSPQDLSPDTLKALDWMLQNITKLAEQGDESLKKEFSLDGDSTSNTGFPIPNELFPTDEDAEIVKPVKRTKSRKGGKKSKKLRKGMSKLRKGGRGPQSLELHSGEFKPVEKRKKKSFPKFRSRVPNNLRARSFGFRTVIDEKPRSVENTGTVDADGKFVNPSTLVEEIARLEAAMSSVERKVKEVDDEPVPFEGNVIHSGLSIPKSVEYADDTAGNSEATRITVETNATESVNPLQYGPPPQALDLNLVPIEKGFLPGSNADFHQQPMHLITEGDIDRQESRWTEWGEWNDCFCEKQVRTRRCIYSGVLSQGCQGDSYESRSCVGGTCPVPTERPTLAPRITPPIPLEPHDPRRSFRPFKLYTAVSQS